jgi:hypothetical protein
MATEEATTGSSGNKFMSSTTMGLGAGAREQPLLE